MINYNIAVFDNIYSSRVKAIPYGKRHLAIHLDGKLYFIVRQEYHNK